MTSPIHHCGTCTECAEEPRASRMPPHLPSLYPRFLDALRDPVPEEVLREKANNGGTR